MVLCSVYTTVKVPVLSKGPFGLDLEKSVRYITYIFKGISFGVLLTTIVTVVLLEIDLWSDGNTLYEVSSLKRQIILILCIGAFSLAYFFLCSFLVRGVEERNRTWIFPWFLVTAAVGFGLLIVFLISFTYGFGIIQLILPLIIVAIFYSVLVVYSLYEDLGSNFIPDNPPTQVVPT